MQNMKKGDVKMGVKDLHTEVAEQKQKSKEQTTPTRIGRVVLAVHPQDGGGS